MAKSMNALVFKSPRKVAVEQQPIPQLQDPKDVIVRVLYTAVCGSDLHPYRGTEPCDPGMIMGHELYGEVSEKGKEVRDFQVGDKVISPFTTSCGICFYCESGLSSRCDHSQLYGGHIQGTQAQFIRIPWADGTLVKAPDGLDPKQLVLMADVFPTGFFAASSALALSKTSPYQSVIVRTNEAPVVAVIGSGPVGICGLISALSLLNPSTLFAIDTVSSRLDLASRLGATSLNLGELGPDGVLKRIQSETEGRGADIVLEIVGAKPAVETGFKILRPFGTLVSVGVHSETYPYSMSDAYDKNIRTQFGRCPVRSIFPAALECLRANSEKLKLFTEDTIIMKLEDAVEAYDMFEQRKVGKILLKAWNE